MSCKKKQSEKPKDRLHSKTLRAKAENILESKLENIEEIDPRQAKMLLHELRVHQIELEIQNENLRQTHVELENTIEQYMDLYDNAPAGYATSNTFGVIIRANQTLADMLGTTSSRLLNSNLAPWCKENNAFYKHCRCLANKGGTLRSELQFKNKHGSIVFVSVESKLIQDDDNENDPKIRSVFLDISDRVRIEERLKESEKKARAISHNALDAIVTINHEGSIIYFNPAAQDIFGFEANEIIGKPLHDYIASRESLQAYQKELAQFLETGKSRILGKKLEVNATKKDGTRFPVELMVAAYKHKGQWHFVGTLRDITERRQEEEKIKFSNRFLEISNKHQKMHQLLNDFIREIKKLTGTEAIGIHLLDKKGNLLHQAYEGLSQEFCKRESLLSVKSDRCMFVDMVKGNFDSTLPFFTESGSFYSNDTTGLMPFPFVFEEKTCDECSNAGYKSIALVPIKAADRIVGLIHLADTEKNKITLNGINILEKAAMQLSTAISRVMVEEKLKQAHDNLEQRVREELEKSRQKDFIMMHQSRLAAMGELIGHIAHQWKQPLNALNILFFNMKDALSDLKIENEVTETFILPGEKLIEKMSMTIDDFRRFFKPDRQKEEFNMNKIIEDTLSIVIEDFKYRNISVFVSVEEEITILGFPNEYSQVILNCIVNARDAIIARGIKGEIRIETFRESNSAVVKITDNGGGIPENIFNNIFDPYFTTKEANKGAGIGLYMSKLIIEDHMGGRIEVKNIDNNGAEFKIIIPLNPK